MQKQQKHCTEFAQKKNNSSQNSVGDTTEYMRLPLSYHKQQQQQINLPTNVWGKSFLRRLSASRYKLIVIFSTGGRLLQPCTYTPRAINKLLRLYSVVQKKLHKFCRVITFEPFVLGLQCLHQNAQQKLLLTDR